MKDIKNIKDKITFYQASITLLVIFWLLFLVVGGFIAINWYQQSRNLIIKTEGEGGLLKADLVEVWQTLKSRAQTVESRMEIMYGKDIGKPEPF